MPKVLIVDDDHTTVQLLQTLLELDGFDVAIARTGGEVESVVIDSQPDVILMDYHLTDMDGVDVLRAIRAGGPFVNIPIVMASGLDVEDEVMAEGANAFLIKPFDPDQLAVLFNQLLS